MIEDFILSTFVIKTVKGDVEVAGWTNDVFGIRYMDGDGWGVTHLATGRSLPSAQFGTRQKAEKFATAARAMLPWADITADNSKKFGKAYESVRAFAAEFDEGD